MRTLTIMLLTTLGIICIILWTTTPEAKAVPEPTITIDTTQVHYENPMP